MDFSGRVIDGRYQVLDLIGWGGMGAVYEAQHTLLGRRLAIKFLHSELSEHEVAVTRFCREARIAACLNHPNIVYMADMGFGDSGVPYIVMEYLDGENLHDRLKRERRLSVASAARVTLPVLSALQAAHEAGIVHRDIKPENIFLSRTADGTETVKVLDFGVAKLSHSGTTRLTQTHAVLGTPQYMSPEQAAGAVDVDYRTDIYAVGVVLYQMLTGSLPFSAPNYNALMVQIMKGLPDEATERLSALSPDVAQAIQAAMATDPERRFAQASEFAARVRGFAAPDGSSFAQRARNHGETAQNVPVDAIFIGLDGLDAVVTGEGIAINCRVLDDARALPQVLEESMPCVIAATAAIDFIDIAERFPVFRTSVITIDLLAAGRELTIREWDPDHGAFSLSEAPMAGLEEEVRRFCALPRPLCLHRNEVSEVGLSDHLELAGQSVQVITEVVCRGDIRIRTKVLCEGRVTEQTSRPFEPTAEDALGQLRLAVGRQHAVAIREAEAPFVEAPVP